MHIDCGNCWTNANCKDHGFTSSWRSRIAKENSASDGNHENNRGSSLHGSSQQVWETHMISTRRIIVITYRYLINNNIFAESMILKWLLHFCKLVFSQINSVHSNLKKKYVNNIQLIKSQHGWRESVVGVGMG